MIKFIIKISLHQSVLYGLEYHKKNYLLLLSVLAGRYHLLTLLPTQITDYNVMLLLLSVLAGRYHLLLLTSTQITDYNAMLLLLSVPAGRYHLLILAPTQITDHRWPPHYNAIYCGCRRSLDAIDERGIKDRGA